MKAEGVDCGGYLQWRPIVYLSSAREMTASTESFQYGSLPLQDPIHDLNNTLPYSVLGSSIAGMLVSATNVTFGTSGDGFYHKTKYATW